MIRRRLHNVATPEVRRVNFLVGAVRHRVEHVEEFISVLQRSSERVSTASGREVMGDDAAEI